MDEMDLELLRNYARIIDNMPATAYLMVVIRRDGRPQPEDRQLWRDLQVLLRGSACQPLGLVVVGTSAYWRAPDEGAGAAA